MCFFLKVVAYYRLRNSVMSLYHRACKNKKNNLYDNEIFPNIQVSLFFFFHFHAKIFTILDKMKSGGGMKHKMVHYKRPVVNNAKDGCLRRAPITPTNVTMHFYSNTRTSTLQRKTKKKLNHILRILNEMNIIKKFFKTIMFDY